MAVMPLSPLGGAVSTSAIAASDRASATGAAPKFIDTLDAALKSVSQSQGEAQTLQQRFSLEDPNTSLEETMIAMNKAQISFSAAVQVRNRLVQAYEQMMNMPV